MGSLVVVGTGIQFASHVTAEVRGHLETAEKVIFLVTDPTVHAWICEMNPTAESLHTYYDKRTDRLTSYVAMVERILYFVRQNLRVVAAFYGHPGVFAYPSHEAVRRARAEGFEARMLPAVSAIDCLYADLGVDPGIVGSQGFEATDFLVHNRVFDASSSLVLWQVGVIGELGYNPENVPNVKGLEVLTGVLLQRYPCDHVVVVYEASQYSFCEPRIISLPLGKLSSAQITALSTLYVPPSRTASPDETMMRRLGIEEGYATKRKVLENQMPRSTLST